jgi:hypothetical protein
MKIENYKEDVINKRHQSADSLNMLCREYTDDFDYVSTNGA